jgi:staphylococcal nuclease domain-containing protein 1
MFATVYVGNNKTPSKNVALMMISEGLATCVKHRQEEQRSVKYDSLLLAEAEAIAKGKGMHGSVSPPAMKKLNDVSNDSKKAKALLAILPKSRYRAVIDYVYSGSRFKITIPSENITLQLSLNQIRTPMPSKNASSGSGARVGEAFALEAKKLSRWQLLQRTVDVHIDNSDKNGIALGRIYLLPSNECYGSSLLSHGYGKIDRFVIDNSSIEIDKFIEIQNISKASKVGIWSLESEEVEIEENADENENSSNNNKDGFINIRLSEIITGSSFYYQEKSDAIDQKLTQITNLMTTFSEKRKEPLEPIKPKKGNNCAALFDDGSSNGPTWFRAKIEDIIKDKEEGTMQILVHFIDFGNKDLLPLSSVSDIDQSYFSIPALSKQASLSFLQSASNDLDFGSGSVGVAACRYFGDLCWGNEVDLFMKIISKDFYKVSQVVLYDAEEMKKHKNNIDKINDGTFSDEEDCAISINEKIVMEGFARKSNKLVKNASKFGSGLNNSSKLLLEKLDEAQSIAKNNRSNMFSYGDPGDSDDERESRRR